MGIVSVGNIKQINFRPVLRGGAASRIHSKVSLGLFHPLQTLGRKRWAVREGPGPGTPGRGRQGLPARGSPLGAFTRGAARGAEPPLHLQVLTVSWPP